MSAEAGGTIIGVLGVIYLLGPVLLATAAIAIAGVAVVGAVKLGVAIAQDVNTSRSNAHIASESNSILSMQGEASKQENAMLAQVAEQRGRMLQMYRERHSAIEHITEQAQIMRSELLSSVSSADKMSEQDLNNFRRQLSTTDETIRSAVSESLDQLDKELDNTLVEVEDSISRAFRNRSADIEKKLAMISSHMERRSAGIAMAEETMRQAKDTFMHLAKEEHVTDFIPGEMNALKALLADYEKIKASGAGEAAIATAVSFGQQTMEAYSKYYIAKHRCQLMLEQLNYSTAELRALVEKGNLIGDKSMKLPTDADYWADGMLNPLLTRAKELLDRIDGIVNPIFFEKELLNVRQLTNSLNETLTKARGNYVCALTRMRMMQISKTSFDKNGWKAISWGFEDEHASQKGDYRMPIVLRFAKDRIATADFVLSPVYDQLSREYLLDIKVERSDSGVIDERLRRSQIAQLKSELQKNGLPVELECTEGTEGHNSPRVAQANRFSKPQI